MRKQVLRVSRIFFLVFVLAVLITGCGKYITKNQKADDDISKAIYEKTGKKVHYKGKENKSGYEVWYNYLIRDSKDENLLSDIVETVNLQLEESDMDKTIVIVIWEEISGGRIMVAKLSNNDNGKINRFHNQYLNYLVIRGNNRYSTYSQASSYINLEGIEYLEVIEDVNRNAEEEGIDWYEVFPDLQGYEVFKQDNSGTTIIYQEMKDSDEAEGELLLE